MPKQRRTRDRLFQIGDYWIAEHPCSSNYSIVWYDSHVRRTRRKTTHISDFEQAKLILADYVRNQTIRSGNAKRPNELPVNDAINYYMQRKMQPCNPSRPSSVSALRLLTKFFVAYNIGYVSDLTPDVVDEYAHWRRKYSTEYRKAIGRVPQLLSNATITRELTVLSAALNYCEKRGVLTSAPFIQKLPSPPARELWLTPEDINKLIKAASSQLLRDYILLALHTLQRPRYLYELQIEQVDLKRRSIDFRLPGKIQNRKRRPVIRISDTLLPILQRRIADSQSGFVLEHNGRPIKTSLKKSFKEAVRRSGLSDETVPYTLRHTGATWLAQQGVPLRDISGMMGHTEQKTTEIYAKHHPDFQKDATAVLDAMSPNNESRAVHAPIRFSGTFAFTWVNPPEALIGLGL